eukprot:SAG22_NODE_1931_length_3292_cov_4.886940_1_plen_137_part_00
MRSAITSPTASPPSARKEGLPPADKVYQRMEAAGHMIRLHSMEPALKKQRLVAATVKLTRLRHNAVTNVYDNLVYCNEQDVDYDPAKNYSKGDKKPGPVPRVQSSPGAAARAREALKTAGSQREAVLGWLLPGLPY